MSVPNDKHMKLTNGVGCCSVPMWMGGLPAGFCDEPAYGEQIHDLYEWKGRHAPYASGLACTMHWGPEEDGPRTFQDGTNEKGRAMYCAVYPDFTNLQESPAEFSISPVKAIEKLRLNHPR